MKNYNVRDGSDWEKTLKPRIHERINNSKNVILFLSKITISSRALREEMNYSIKTESLPIIVIYPDYDKNSDIADKNGIKSKIKNLWDQLPVFRDNMGSIPTLHIPMKYEYIKSALENEKFMVNTKTEAGIYYYNT